MKPPDTWRLLVGVDAPVPGSLEDWPNNIAEAVLREIERQCKPRVGWEVRVFFSGCLRDHDIPLGTPGAWYLDVQVGEFPTDETMKLWEKGMMQ